MKPNPTEPVRGGVLESTHGTLTLVLFAAKTASSSVSNENKARTGANVSSLEINISCFAPTMIVGSKKYPVVPVTFPPPSKIWPPCFLASSTCLSALSRLSKHQNVGVRFQLYIQEVKRDTWAAERYSCLYQDKSSPHHTG
jgi:hypothetical protein